MLLLENALENQGEQAKYLLQRDRALSTIVLSADPTRLHLFRPDHENSTVVSKKVADQFQKKTWKNKLALRRKLYNLKLKDGQSMQKHVKMLAEIFDKLSVIGDPLDKENQVVHLWASLPESCEMLAMALEASPDVSETFLHNVTKQRDKESSTIERKAMTSKHQTSRKDPKCHHCGRFEHMKRECRMLQESHGKNQNNRTTSYSNKKRLRKQKAYAAEEDTDDEEDEIVGLVTDHALSDNRRSNCFVDSDANCHRYNNEELFDKVICVEMPQEITVGDGHSIQATGRGDVILRMNMPNGKIRKCIISDALYVPDLSLNLLSVSKAASNGERFEFRQSHCNIIDNKFGVISTATKCGNLYYLNCAGSNLYVKENHIAVKCASTDRTKQSIWHRRYGHFGARKLERIAKEKVVDGFNYEPKKESSFCEPCVDGKQSTLPFLKIGGERSNELLGIAHSDVCGKTETNSLSGAEYYVTFIDDKSRFVWVYTLNHKSEVFEKLTEWKLMVEKCSGMKVKVLRTDNGGEYT